MKLHYYPSPYGASMGRASFGHDFAGRIYVSRVRLDSGGYDSGGAYWGHGEPLYAASDTIVGDATFSKAFATVRAKSRAEAIAKIKAILPNATPYKP